MKISGSRIDLENGRIDNAVLKNYGETLVGGVSGATSGTAYTVDISAGNMFHIFLSANCTFTFSNPTPSGTACYFTLLLKQDGATRTATWPSTVTWAGGSAPTLATAGGAHDIISFFTADGGSSYIGFVGGQSFPPEPAATLYNLFAWGRNNIGQIGDGTAVDRSVPTQIGTLSSWATVASVSGNLLTRTDGTLWAWGNNPSGAGGAGDIVYRSSPNQVGGMINWSVSTSGGYKTAHFIKNDGTLWSWGSNFAGQTGDRTVVNRSSPVQVGTLTTWSSVAGSYVHAVGLQTNGTLWVWGSNVKGYLGLGDVVARSSPTQLGTLATWSRIATGATFTAAIKTDGTMWTWGGYNESYGQLGLGDVISRSSPTQVGTLATWSQVNGGGVARHAIALKTDGTIWTWGQNAHGQLGLGDRAVGSTYRSSPVQVGTLSNWSRIAASSIHTAAINTSNELWIWGKSSSFGTLGLGDVIGRSSPVQVGGGSGWASVALNVSHTLALQDPALLASGTLFAWGKNIRGELGFGDVIYRSSPTQLGSDNTWSTLAEAYLSSLAIKSDGNLWGFGRADSGDLGLPDVINRSSPVQIGGMLPAAKAWTSVASGTQTASALRADGTHWTWGINGYGRLGVGDALSRSSPTQIGTLTTWAQSAISWGYHRSGVGTDGALWIWGKNQRGQLGLGDVVARSSPVQIGTLATWAKFAGAISHSVALKTDGTLWAWGYNNFGTVGVSDVVPRSSPVQLGTLTWLSLETSGYSNAAVRSDRTLWTWGWNKYGQLGLGDAATLTTARSSPTQVGTLATWATVSLGRGSSMSALKTDGTLWMWGHSIGGSLGDGTAIDRSSPVQVGTLGTWVRIAQGSPSLGLLWTGAASAPSAPRNVVAVAGAASGTVVVSFTLPAKSGSKPITQYTVTSSPGSIIATGSNNVILVTGLTNNTPYTFTVTATNAVGTSSASAKSNVVTPPVQGGLWVWGRANDGMLGLEDTINRSSPTQVGAATSWSELSNGHRSGGGIKTDGTLWMWGRAYYGGLGLNDNISRSSPSQMGTLTNWSKLAVGNDFGAAVKTDGTLWAWGSNGNGNLGRGTTASTSSPIQIGTLATWRSVGLGRYNMFAIKTDGTLWATGGAATYGLHGLNDTISRSSPTQVGTLADWSKVTGNTYGTHVFGLRSNGTIWSWGRDIYGRLGRGLTFSTGGNSSSPAQIGTLTDWADIAATGSGYITAALKTNGTLWTWGHNNRGGLGIGDRIYRSSPAQVGTLGTWAAIAVGRRATAAIKTDGTLWAWGGNAEGKLGQMNVVYRSSPVQIGTLATWQQIRGGFGRFHGIR